MILYDCGMFVYELLKPCYKTLYEQQSNHTERMAVVRNILLNEILDTQKRFKQKYGKIILCFDSNKGYWRKDYFKYYKSNRKKAQSKDDFDWKELFDCIEQFRQEVNEYLPCVSLSVDKCEADDIIAILCKYYQTHETDILDNPHNHIVISNDHDLAQLQYYPSITNFSPKKGKEIILNPHDVHKLIIEHICCGDTGDGVMNICSDDDVFNNDDKKQKPFRKSRLEQFYVDGIDACQNDIEKRNYQRNKKLVDLIDEIPQEIEETIIKKYKEAKPVNLISEYMIKYRLGNLYEKLQTLL